MQVSQGSTPHHLTETDDEAELELTTPRRRPSCPSELQSDDESISEYSGPPKKARKAIKKTSDDAVPLPDPFPLPTHFGARVEVALESQKMTNAARKAFISKVAFSMLYYKQYPSREDYANVGRIILQKYPFMKSPAGSPAVRYHLYNLKTQTHGYTLR